MNYKMIGLFFARILSVEGIFLIPPLLIALFSGERAALLGLLVTLAAIALIAVLFFLICRGAPSSFNAKEGFVCVGVSWVVLSLLGCLPFVISGVIPNYIDALFEIVSGFTTTGASVLSDVESLPKSLLFWRSFTNWLGGMGVLVFLLAFTPNEGRGSGMTVHLLRAESPGPDVGKLVPKMKKTALILYAMYIILTVLNVVFLLFGGMDLFEAFCTAFSSAGTGGFGIRNDSMGSFSPYIQIVTTVFILLFGINFSCYYLLLIGQVRNVLRDEELRLYIGLVVGSIVLITWNLYDIYGSIGETLRHAAFQVASIITTTGFSSVDFDLWPTFSKTILLGLMIVGACAGSTGGGLKCSRLLLLLKNLRRNIRQLIHPKQVIVVRNNERPVSEKVLVNTNAYLAAYTLIVVVSVLLVSLDASFSVEGNVSAVLACFNNIGPAFAEFGPLRNYADYSILSKLVLIFDMLAGRLEIFPILVLFSVNTWRNR
ncbi:MAG: TrkH family potassium uptake protein [Clostridia bacterium]|nr:TrkH family potassium uptake protein [Clostridia bacterium]